MKGFGLWAEEFKKEGEVNLLQRQIAKRFGNVPRWVVLRLQKAELHRLELWGGRLFEINSLEELFEDE